MAETEGLPVPPEIRLDQQGSLTCHGTGSEHSWWEALPGIYRELLPVALYPETPQRASLTKAQRGVKITWAAPHTGTPTYRLRDEVEVGEGVQF